MYTGTTGRNRDLALSPCRRCRHTTSRITKIPTLVFPTSTQASRHVALMIESLIRQNNSANRPTVLGLATGSTPVGLYRELIRLHKEAGLDFSRVITFNLDEYYPMAPDDDHSYRRWMHETFFKHINIQPGERSHPRRHDRADRRRGVLRPLRADDPPGRRHRPANPRHRPQRPHRLQRAGLDAAQPDAARHARSGDAPGRGRRASSARRTCRTRRSRWASARSSKPARSSSWRSASTRRRSSSRRVEEETTEAVTRQLPAEASATPRSFSTRPRPGHLTPIRMPWVRRLGQLDAEPDSPGGDLAEPAGRQGAAQAVRRRFPRARAVRIAPRARPGASRSAGASSTR